MNSSKMLGIAVAIVALLSAVLLYFQFGRGANFFTANNQPAPTGSQTAALTDIPPSLPTTGSSPAASMSGTVSPIPTSGATPMPTGNPSTTPRQDSEEEVDIEITPNGFVPASVTVTMGMTIAWTNNSGSDTSINSDPHPAHNAYPIFNAGTVANGSTVRLTLNTAGTYIYHSETDPTKKGSVTVLNQ